MSNAVNAFVNALARLINVRSLIILIYTIVLSILIMKNPTPELITLFGASNGAIVAFFFNRKEDLKQ